MRYLLPCLILFALAGALPVQAQPQCGVADSISYPVDPTVFSLVQDFRAPSPRHQGRYHTGEDWYAGRTEGYGYGQPVRAAAAGRVTYSSPIGWGRDGGVIIIEHTFPDDSIAYTQYGHLAEVDAITFPAPYSCVAGGEVIAAIGDARPAPHLHFEVRVSMPSSPGPGYTWDDPLVRGWRDPGRFIENWTAYFDPAVLWHVDLRTERGLLAPPLPLSDESLLVIDGGRLVRITPDGRLLWRINLDRPAVAITLHENVPLLTYADGTMQRVNIDGTLGERWATGIALSGPAFAAGDALIFPAADGALTAFDAARQSVLWRLDGVGVPRQSHFTGQLIGLTTTDARLLTLSAGGAPLDTATLRGTGSLADNGDGTLLAYTYGGLWSILSDGVWQLALADAPASDDSRAALRGPDEALYLFDGAALSAYTRDGTLRWQGTLPPVSGAVTLAHYDDALLLTSTGGHILAIDPASGGLCGTLKVHGDDAAALWRDLGADGVLRIAVSDQILGLDWARLRGGCAA